MLWANSADDKLIVLFFLFFVENRMTPHANCLLKRQFAWSVKYYFLGKIRKIFQNVIYWNFLPQHAKLSKGKEHQFLQRDVILIALHNWLLPSQKSLHFFPVWN